MKEKSQTVSLVEEKLPRDVKLSWSKEVIKDGSVVVWENKFSQLLKFLQEQRRLIEYANADIRLTKNENTGCMHHVNQDHNRQCLIHATNNHSTQNCRSYISMDPRARIDLINSHRACYSCLKPSHYAKNCQLAKKCGKESCVKRHHETLHEAHVQGLVLRASMTNNDGNESCLLQLMKINCAKGHSAQLTVLWDSGAQLCLITFRKARELGIRGRPTQLSLTKVGAVEERVPSYVYDVPLVDKSGNITNIKAYGINEISSEIQCIDVAQVVHLFEGISISDIERPSGFVDLLLGFNYAGIHPVRERVSGNVLLLSNVLS